MFLNTTALLLEAPSDGTPGHDAAVAGKLAGRRSAGRGRGSVRGGLTKCAAPTAALVGLGTSSATPLPHCHQFEDQRLRKVTAADLAISFQTDGGRLSAANAPTVTRF